MPLISVCIPAYNRAALLPVLLDSILDQDFDDFDIVLAEDFSPEREGIATVMARYDAQYPGKLHYHQNARTFGYDGNLRNLIELASGDYILFMGNDDLLAPGALSAVADASEEYENMGVLLRSYASFIDDPAEPEQQFRYFDSDRFFPAGSDTIITFFRRSVFISGMVVRREAALACSTDRFDSTLLYQQHLVGQILAKENGVYLGKILSYHRLGGTPDFGASVIEQEKFVPKVQTPDSSIHFMQGMLLIAQSLDASLKINVSKQITRDIGNYSYPILSIQANQPPRIFMNYLWQLAKLGFWKVPLFYVYASALLILRRPACDRLISFLKKKKGRALILGKVYSGTSRDHTDKKIED